jgi:hypothetical protein
MSSSFSGESKSEKENHVKTIGTRDGHVCGEALACYMLKVLPEYKDARYSVQYMCVLRMRIDHLLHSITLYSLSLTSPSSSLSLSFSLSLSL